MNPDHTCITFYNALFITLNLKNKSAQVKQHDNLKTPKRTSWFIYRSMALFLSNFLAIRNLTAVFHVSGSAFSRSRILFTYSRKPFTSCKTREEKLMILSNIVSCELLIPESTFCYVISKVFPTYHIIHKTTFYYPLFVI